MGQDGVDNTVNEWRCSGVPGDGCIKRMASRSLLFNLFTRITRLNEARLRGYQAGGSFLVRKVALVPISAETSLSRPMCFPATLHFTSRQIAQPAILKKDPHKRRTYRSPPCRPPNSLTTQQTRPRRRRPSSSLRQSTPRPRLFFSIRPIT